MNEHAGRVEGSLRTQRRPSRWAIVYFCLAVTSMSCREHKPPEVQSVKLESSRPSESSDPDIAALSESRLTRIQLGLTGLSLSVPDASNWERGESFGSWVALGHQAAQEELMIRLVIASPSVSRKECQQDVRLSLARLRRLESAAAQQPWQTSFGAKGQLSIYSLPEGGVLIWGVAVAPRRCLSVVYSIEKSESLLLLSARFIGLVLPSLDYEERKIARPQLN